MSRAAGDTIVALSSGMPPAAVAIVRTSGPAAFAAARALSGRAPLPRQASLRTLRHPVSGVEVDQAILLAFAGPGTATGEDVVEYQCHGGRAVVAAVIDALTSCDGIRLAEPGEFTRRSLANGRIDLTEAEGLADLLSAETESQRRAALAAARGQISRVVEQFQDGLVALSARAEAAIDYIDDADETAIAVPDLIQEIAKLRGEFLRWLQQPRAERLRNGIRVVVAGPPNAGKSSLVNALAGAERAIVTDVPGTTRDVIETPVALRGVPLVLVDTAGMRDTSEPVEAIGIARAAEQVQLADILVWLGKVDEAPPHDQFILVRTKSDLGALETASLNVSALTRENLDRLVDEIIVRASALLPGEGDAPLNLRQAEALAAASDFMNVEAGADLVLVADALRSARFALDRVTGRAGIEETLDAVFGRFCLGK